MIDRAISIIGIAISLLTFALPNYFPNLPAWVWSVSLIVGAVVTGIGVGIIISGSFSLKRRLQKSALLRLHMFGDHRAPEKIESDNIFRWYYLQAILHEVGTSGISSAIVSGTLFISFENDIVPTTIKISSPDIQLPIYEVKEFNPRYAIICFSAGIPMGTVEIRVTI